MTVHANRLGNDEAWLEVAEKTAQFIMDNGQDEDGRWHFMLHRDGTLAEPYKSVYVDAFVMYGLTEYAWATGDPRATDLALAAHKTNSEALQDHSSLATEPHPIPPGAQSHGPLMIFAYTFHELGVLTGREDVLHRALELAETIMIEHVKPDRELLLEFVRPGGALFPGDEGHTFVPGHAIESMWFLERIYSYHGRSDRARLLADVVKWNLRKGWDDEYGGLFLACNAAGETPAWHQPDAKVWWPHTEALYALIRFHELYGEPWLVEWYDRMHEYTFSTFPDVEHGEWHQNLDREGRVVPVVVKNLAVKDPFHLPRALILAIESLKRQTNPPTNKSPP